MEIYITIGNGLAGYEFKQDGRQVNFEDMTRLEQVRVCNALARGYELHVRLLKEEGGQ